METKGSKKILIVTFTKNEDKPNIEAKINNTKRMALLIQNQLQCDLFEIIPAEPYSNIVDDIAKRAKKERKDKARPAIKYEVKNFDSYEVIFFGYPIWFGDLPMPVYTFIEQNNWKGKTIIPFCSHENIDVKNTFNIVKDTIKEANVLDGYGIPGKDVDENETEIEKWLKGLNL